MILKQNLSIINVQQLLRSTTRAHSTVIKTELMNVFSIEFN